MFGFGLGNVRWSGLEVYNPDFMLLVKTDNTGTSANNQFTIPTTGSGYNYTVTTSEQTLTNQTGNVTLEWAVAGTYEVRISGDFPRMYFNNGGDKLKLLEVQNWGSIVWGNTMDRTFFGCSNMNITATDVPNLSNVVNINSLFNNCLSLTYNPSINNWDVSNIEIMSFVFFGCTNFNQPLNNWDVSNVTTMVSMFNGATSFNQPLNNWDVSNVVDMSTIFRSATSFDQDLSTWNLSSVTNISQMFLFQSMSITNYSNTLIGWANLMLQSDLTFSGGSSKYNTAGSVARQKIIDDFNWTITDGGAE